MRQGVQGSLAGAELQMGEISYSTCNLRSVLSTKHLLLLRRFLFLPQSHDF
jgi:hypothetical protein